MKRFAGYTFGLVAALSGALGCSAGGAGGTGEEGVASRSERVATYDLRSLVSDALRADSRGWEIEWEIPQIANQQAAGAIGQWYWNLESGVYHTGDGWFVYYYGDDNGLTGADPACDTQWGSGGICHGIYANLQPGQRVLFRYEYCTPGRVASVNGTQLCLYVNLNDGAGLRFLAEDDRTTDEMYAHDIENFDAFDRIGVSCTAPTRMVKQRRQTSSGTWVNMTGASSWRFESTSSTDRFQTISLSANPATWTSCTGSPPAETCTDGIWNGIETGVDCGGFCSPCAGSCQEQPLPRVSAVASSQENASLNAAAAIDGNAGTRWASTFSDPQWIYVDLGTARRVSALNLSWEAAASANFDIEVSSSASGPWQAVTTQAVGGGSQFIPFTPTVARYVRLYSRARTTPYGVSLWEMQVLGDQNPSCGSSGPTCTDGLQNGGETGVDCGGSCAPCASACLNQALTRTAAVASSQENAGSSASQAIDGSLSTRWSSAFSDPQWVYVDLGSVQRVRRVLLSWEAAASLHYEIDVASSASGPWSKVYETTSGNGGTDDITGLGAVGRYVRMYSYSRTTPYGNSLWELQVFGDPNPTCTL